MRALLWATLLGAGLVLAIAESNDTDTYEQREHGLLAINTRRGRGKNSSGARRIWGGGLRRPNKSGKRRNSKKRGQIIKCCGKNSCLSSNQHQTGDAKNKSYTRLPGSRHSSTEVPSKDAAAGGLEKMPPPAAPAIAADGAATGAVAAPTGAAAAPEGDAAAPTEVAAAGGGEAAAAPAAPTAAPADAAPSPGDGAAGAAPGVTDAPAAGGGEVAPPPPAPTAGDAAQTSAAAQAATQPPAASTTASGGGAAAPASTPVAAAAASAVTTPAAGGEAGGATTAPAPAASASTTAAPAGAASTTPAAAAASTTTAAASATTTVTLKPCAATCPQACAKNNSLFASNVLIEPDGYGFWRNKCGKSYLFGTELFSWQNNWAKCCSLGMKPITIDTKDQQLCLGNTVKGSWFGTLNYWSSGSRAGCPVGSSFTWCASNTAVASGVEWDQGQPDNAGGAQTCVHLKVNPKTGTVTLSDRNCSNVYPLACEDVAVRNYDCDVPTCSANCTKDLTLFQTTPEYKLNNHATYGSWLEVKGRLYMFSALPASWQEASASCCKLGMSLVSLETSTETANLYAKATQRSTYWTSGTDTGCDDYYGWCGSSKTFVDTQVSWATGMPRGVTYHCVTATLGATKITLADEMCDKKLPFICEVRSTKLMKPGKAVMEECIQQLGLTTAEISAISATSVSATMPAKTKCYLKCVGEQLGIFNDGVVVEAAALSMIEQLYATDDFELQDHYDSFETCYSEVDPKGNECETAYLIYKCAVDYADFPSFIAQVDTNMTAEISPLPCAPTCL